MCAVFNRNKKMKNEDSFAQNSPLTRFVDTRTAFTFRTKQQTTTKLNTAVVDTLDFHLTPIFISILIRCCNPPGVNSHSKFKIKSLKYSRGSAAEYFFRFKFTHVILFFCYSGSAFSQFIYAFVFRYGRNDEAHNSSERPIKH